LAYYQDVLTAVFALLVPLIAEDPPPITWAASYSVASVHAKKVGKPLLLVNFINGRTGSRFLGLLGDGRIRGLVDRFIPVQITDFGTVAPVSTIQEMTDFTVLIVKKSDGTTVLRHSSFVDKEDLQNVLESALWSLGNRTKLEARAKGGATPNECAQLAAIYFMSNQAARASSLVAKAGNADKALRARLYMAIGDQMRCQIRYKDALPHFIKAETLFPAGPPKYWAQYKIVSSLFRTNQLEPAISLATLKMKQGWLTAEQRDNFKLILDRMVMLRQNPGPSR
jgi:hypothetical protein